MKIRLALPLFLGISSMALAQAPQPARLAPVMPNNTAQQPNHAMVQSPVGANPSPTVAAPPSPDAPKFYCAHPVFDFGNMDEGPDITHEFRFKNSGRTPLKITHVATSCGCTAAVVEENGVAKTPSETDPVVIPPGARSSIKATYHTSGRVGHAEKIITVTSNDPVNPQFQIHMSMTVVREIDVQPDKLYLYGIHHGQARDTEVKITGKPGMQLDILSAVATNNKVTLSPVKPFSDDKENKTGATFTVSVPATYDIGNFTDEIVVKTNNAKKPEIKIDVLGEVVGKVQYNPKQFYFPAHSQMPVTVILSVEQPNGFTIRKVESTKHLVRAYSKVTSTGGNQQFLIIAEPVNHVPDDSDGKDQVVIWTNDPEQPNLSIEVQVNK
jgi:hypothetical protein